MTDSDTALRLRARDMLTVEDLFIRDGYVLRFSDAQTAFNDRTFRQFFMEELKIDIDDPKWSQEGGGPRESDFGIFCEMLTRLPPSRY